MKTLVNCTPSEFISQTYKIKKAVEKWLDITKVLEIRKTPVNLESIDKNLPEEEQKKALREALNKQARKNLSDMFDSMFGEHPNETLELVALMCFIEPKDIDNYEIREIFGAFNEIINDEAVVGFFTSLMRSGQTATQKQ